MCFDPGEPGSLWRWLERKMGGKINEACRSGRMKITGSRGVKKDKSRVVDSRPLVLIC